MNKAKLTLSLEALQVQSFTTQDTDRARGTVQANEDTATTPCWHDSDVESCGGSCDYTYCDAETCMDTCAWSCGLSCACATVELSCNHTLPLPDGTCCRVAC